ncbi:MAG: hypothetical protein ABIC04_08930 [Nanoarchaeota archaeon]
MKKVVWVIILLLAVNCVSSTHSIFIKDSLNEGDAKAYKTDNGIYILELVIVSGESTKFKINNILSDTLKEGKSEKLKDGSELVIKRILQDGKDEVEFYFYASGENPIKAEIEDTWDIKDCNFDGFCINETQDKCCYDCRCDSGNKCEYNRCIRQNGCGSDDECIDDDPCTTDVCDNGKCQYQKMDGCILKNDCVKYETVEVIDNKPQYCSKEGWKIQKENEKECDNNYECLSDECKDNECYVQSYAGLYRLFIAFLLLGILIFIETKLKIYRRIKKKLFWKF